MDIAVAILNLREVLEYLEGLQPGLENPVTQMVIAELAKRNGKAKARRQRRKANPAWASEEPLTQPRSVPPATEGPGEVAEEKPKRRGRPRKIAPVPASEWDAPRRAQEAKESASSTP